MVRNWTGKENTVKRRHLLKALIVYLFAISYGVIVWLRNDNVWGLVIFLLLGVPCAAATYWLSSRGASGKH